MSYHPFKWVLSFHLIVTHFGVSVLFSWSPFRALLRSQWSPSVEWKVTSTETKDRAPGRDLDGTWQAGQSDPRGRLLRRYPALRELLLLDRLSCFCQNHRPSPQTVFSEFLGGTQNPSFHSSVMTANIPTSRQRIVSKVISRFSKKSSSSSEQTNTSFSLFFLFIGNHVQKPLVHNRL